MKYVKKPIAIEAFRLARGEGFPEWFTDAFHEGKVTLISDESGIRAYIETLEGTMLAREGSYIIRGVRGELYPCEGDIFEQTYDPVEEFGE